MTTLYSADELRERLSPVDLLTRLGHKPLTVRSEHEYVYFSMLRPDKHGQFLADSRLNLWFDRSGENLSGIRSGDVLDLGKALFHPISAEELLNKLSAISQRTEPRRKRCALRLPHYQIADIRPLGSSTEISDFLRAEGWWELGLGHLKEIYYYVIDEKRRRKDFCAAGWPNENGGWEVRAKHFSGCIGKRGMTFLPGDNDRLIVFISFMDYLAWRYAFRDWTHSVLILNDMKFLSAGHQRSRHFAETQLYLGQEFVGPEFIQELLDAGAPKIYAEN